MRNMSRDKYDELDTINEAYPNRFKAFEFKKCRIPQNYWCDRNNRIDAIRWLIDKLKREKGKAPGEISYYDF